MSRKSNNLRAQIYETCVFVSTLITDVRLMPKIVIILQINVTYSAYLRLSIKKSELR